MGTWGVKIFENDAASDWLEEFVGSSDLSPAERCIGAVEAAGQQYLDAELGAEAIAAASALALLSGRGTGDEPEELERWADQHRTVPPADLLARARAVVGRVLASPSELASLWSESELSEEWRITVNDLRERLT
jgi:hypothetical protein